MRPTLKYVQEHNGIVAGVDEAGRGPLAGPVVAAAAILDVKKIPKGINDSKQLSHAKREALYAQIIENTQYAVGIASVAEIDELNILGATKLAMRRAVAGLPLAIDVALVDGNQPPGLSCKTITIVEGDAKCLAIASASIIAKVTRDRIMKELAREHPGYGWETNMGYGTRAHYAGLQQYGITPHHRTSFEPVSSMVRQFALPLLAEG